MLRLAEDTGTTYRSKTRSTPGDQSGGVLNGIRKVCRDARIYLAEIGQVLHGTAVATNAILRPRSCPASRFRCPVTCCQRCVNTSAL